MFSLALLAKLKTSHMEHLGFLHLTPFPLLLFAKMVPKNREEGEGKYRRRVNGNAEKRTPG